MQQFIAVGLSWLYLVEKKIKRGLTGLTVKGVYCVLLNNTHAIKKIYTYINTCMIIYFIIFVYLLTKDDVEVKNRTAGELYVVSHFVQLI